MLYRHGEVIRSQALGKETMPRLLQDVEAKLNPGTYQTSAESGIGSISLQPPSIIVEIEGLRIFPSDIR